MQSDSTIYYLCFASPRIYHHKEGETGNHYTFDLRTGLPHHFSFDPDRGNQASPGKQAAYEITGELDWRVNSFFKEGKIPDFGNWKEAQDKKEKIYNSIEIAVPEKYRERASLVVLMDEPTTFMSYRHETQFRERITELSKKYQGRIQFIIATNDAGLIERPLLQPIYLDFNATPVKPVRAMEQLHT